MQYGAEVHVTSPELVAISPDVQVVADADEPLFYADGYYWLYRDSVWLRSDSYRGGFARVDVNIVPGTIRTIQQPVAYSHYRRHGGRAYARPAQVQTRTQQPQPRPQQAPPPQQAPRPFEAPTEPMPTSPTQKPPVPNPMPGSERAEPHDMRSDSADKPNLPDKVDNSDRIDHTDRNKTDKPDKADKPEKGDKPDKKDKQRDYGE